MDKISVIVPVYKVEAYLDECVNSIVNQTYKNLEIILVDDGSPDNCPKMCDEWSKKDSRIKVIHKKNGGLSDARNAGIDVSTGDYISFIDSDDYIEKNMYEIAITTMKEESAQIFICGRYYLYGEKKEIQQQQNVKVIMDNVEALDKMNTFCYYDVAAWDKVYKKSLFDGIRYPVGKLSEDWFTTYKVIDRATKVVYDSAPLYVYRQRANSITHSGNKKINEDCIDASKEVFDYIANKYPQIKLNALTSYVYASIGVYNNYVSYRGGQKQKIKSLRNDIKENYKVVIKNKDLTKSRKIQLFMLVKLGFIYIFLIKIFKKYKSNKAK